MAQQTLEGIYPAWDIDQLAIEKADALLARDIPGGLRRIVSEGQDRATRALRNRLIDAEAGTI